MAERETLKVKAVERLVKFSKEDAAPRNYLLPVMIVLVIIRRIMEGHHGILHQPAAPASTTLELSRENGVCPHQLRVRHCPVDRDILIDAGLPEHGLPQVVVTQIAQQVVDALLFEIGYYLALGSQCDAITQRVIDLQVGMV